MISLTHDVFGTVDFDPGEEHNEWESETPWAGGAIHVDITFHGAAMNASTLDRLGRYVTDLGEFDRKARTAMRANAGDEDSAVRDYMEHHLDERQVSDLDAFVASLRLVRVGLYAGIDWAQHEAVFDYSIGPEHTQYLVVVKFDEDGGTGEIAMES